MPLSRPCSSKYPLSDLQKGMLYHTLTSTRKSTYLVQKIIRFLEPVNMHALEQAWTIALARYPVLRSYFDSEESYYTHQCVQNECSILLQSFDYQSKMYDSSQIDSSFSEFLLTDAEKGIALSSPPLMRLSCLTYSESLTYFIWSYHHALMGGPSTIQVLTEVFSTYDALKSGNTPVFKDEPSGFYIPGRSEECALIDEDAHRHYWQTLFAGSEASGHLPGNTAKKMPKNQPAATRQTVYRFMLDKTITTQLQTVAANWNLTPSTFIFGAWGLVLSRHVNNPDVVFGAVRAYPQSIVENRVGLFINTLPIKVSTENQTVETYLRAIRHQYQQLAQCISIPLSKLQRWVGLPPGDALFETFVDFKQHSLNETLKTRLGDQWANKYAYQHFDINYAFSLEVQEEDGCYIFDINYESDLFSTTMIERYAHHYQLALLFLLRDPVARLDELALVEGNELQVLNQFSGREHCTNPDLHMHTILDRFDETAKANPDKTILLDDETQMTAQDVYHQSVLLANQLNKTISPADKQTIVAILLEQCTQTIVGILAIWRSGKAFLPIDIACPKSRIEYMLSHASVTIILSNTATINRFSYLRELDYTLINMDEIVPSQTKNSGFISENETLRPQANQLAYVIYTSGTTGQPKGVKVLHHNLANYVKWFSSSAKLVNKDVSILMLPYYFDAAYTNLFPALSLGNQLCIPSQNTLQDVYSILQFIEKNAITYIKFTPSFFHIIIHSSFCDTSVFSLRHLRLIILGGEPIDVNDVSQFHCLYPFVAVMNHYGPTEATIGCIATTIPFDDYPRFKSLPVIGKPITGAFVAIVDPHTHLQPIGVMGELLIGGHGLSQGYLANPELTAGKFVRHPAFPDQILYKTGDLAYWLDDGNIRLCSRQDSQIKIRGHRIESQEIAQAILALGIANHVELCKISTPSGSDRLVAYIEPSESTLLSKKDAPHDRDVIALSSWAEMYDQLYGLENRDELASFATGTWVSAYDHEKIPATAMKEWQQAIIERIAEHGPGRVLEIGCGTGLILLGLQNKYASYVGIDMSNTAIDILNKKIHKFAISRATLACATAHELDDLALLRDVSFDTIILNSVVQYFPCLDYLDDVLAWCVSKITDSGVIIIGDVRDYRLAKAYYDSLFLANHQHAIHDVEKRRNYQYARQVQEKELLIDPEYFIDFGSKHHTITHVHVLAKQGSSVNELTTWRYDVIFTLSTVKQLSHDEECITCHQYNPDTGLSHYFEKQEKAFWIRSYPNDRLWSNYWATAYMEGRVEETLIDHVPLTLAAIYSLAKQRGYVIKPYLAMGFQDAAAYLDLLFVKAGLENSFHSLATDSTKRKTNTVRLSTHPLFAYQDTSALKASLAEKLPEYMIPQQFIFVPEIPVTRNRKVDKARLISLGVATTQQASNANHVPPQNEIECQLAQIWQDILRVEPIGVLDDFFALGGDSILCIQFISKCRAAGLFVQLIEFIDNPCIAAIAPKVSQSTIAKPPAVQPDAEVPLTPIQHWFFDRNLIQPGYYNQAFFISLDGFFEQQTLEKLFNALVEQHDGFRLRYRQDESGTWHQHYDFSPFAKLFHMENFSHLDESDFNEACRRCQSQFHLERGPLLTIAFRCHHEQTDMLIAAHHLVVDGVSWRIVLADIEAWISAYQQGVTINLGEKTDSYQQWSRALANSVQSGWFEKDYSYWKTLAERCKGKRFMSFSAQSATYKDIAQLSFELSPEDSSYLTQVLPEQGGLRIHEFLFAVFVLSLRGWKDGEAILLHLEGHGREACIEGVDVSQTVGWFTSVFPVLVDFSNAHDEEAEPLTIYQWIMQQLREQPHNGIGFGLLRTLRPGSLPKWVALLGNSKLKFNYLGQFQEASKEQAIRSKFKWNEATVSPDNQPDYLLFLQALIQNGQLRCEFRYHSSVFQLEEIQHLVNTCHQRIHSVIEYLKNRADKNNDELIGEKDDLEFDTHEF